MTSLLCIHLGKETGERKLCPTCSGKVEVKLRSCEIYGKCTTHKKVDDIACCQGCSNYEPTDDPALKAAIEDQLKTGPLLGDPPADPFWLRGGKIALSSGTSLFLCTHCPCGPGVCDLSQNATHGSQTFTANDTWTAPAGVVCVNAECWGAGGAGGTGSTTGALAAGGGGGGGGCYVEAASLSVIPGNNYDVEVGTGGPVSGPGGGGGPSSFNFSPGCTNCGLAAGGIIGGSGDPSENPGGAGGSAASSIGSTKFSGGDGGKGEAVADALLCAAAGGGGGAGGPGGAGGNGQDGTSAGGVVVGGTGGTSPGNVSGGEGGDGGEGNSSFVPSCPAGVYGDDGSAPGGGGGGAGLSATGTPAGNGANGKVKLTW